MDDRRFDRLTRLLASGTSRRVAAGAVFSSTLATLFADSPEESAARKKRKKKKKKQPPPSPPPGGCTPSCFNKVCGQDDGCGSPCTTQVGCDTDEACIGGQCVPNTCNPACTGNHICQPNGTCACPPGLKECDGPGYFGNCHECCVDAFPTAPDAECIGSAGGPYCGDDDGDLVYRCECFPGQRPCGGGACGTCCDTFDCFFDVFGTGQIVDSGRDCVIVNQETGELGCRCRQGFARCGTTSVCAAPGDPKLCGANCIDCTRFSGFVCRGNPERCCIPEFGSCLVSEDCCPGLGCVQQTQPPFEFVCA
jgi:hypothetical protein